MTPSRTGRPIQTGAVIRTPRHLDLEITCRCNLRCRYCYYFGNKAVEYRDLPAREWLRFFDEMGRCAVMRVTLQGGEPFMREDLRTLIEGIVANRMRFSILSNGLLLDRDMAAFLAATRRCDSVQISVDGSTADVHDATRGKGSYDGAVRAIRLLQSGRVPVGVRVTISRHNLHDLENIARFLIEEMDVEGFSTNSACYFGACRSRPEEVILSIPERMLAMETLVRLRSRYKGRISANAGPLADAETWQRMENARSARKRPFPEGGRLTGCGCPLTGMAIRSDGVMIPCVMLAHMELGRINRNSLEEVWQCSPVLRRLRERQAIPLSSFDFCQGCPHIPYCTGNCPGLAYTLTGEVDHPSPDACLRLFLAQGGRLGVSKRKKPPCQTTAAAPVA